MEYRPIDPRVYGVTLISEPQQSIEPVRNVIEPRQPIFATNNGRRFAGLEASTRNQTQSEPEGGTPMSDENTSIELPCSEQRSPSSPANMLVTRSPAGKNSPQVSATDTSKREAQKKIQQEKRAKRAAEKRQQILRQRAARASGCDPDSITTADIREYMDRWSEDEAAEQERRQALSAAERREEDIQAAARYFQSYVNTELGPCSKRLYPAFLLQVAPNSANGAQCQLIHCKKRILPGDYRIAVEPGKSHWSGSPDLYHLICFEQLLDLSSSTYATRFEPETRHFPGPMEAYILKEYVRRWVARVGVQEPAFPEHIWGQSVNEGEPERYFVSKTDQDYDERHSLSNALAAYQEYSVQEN
ncbi:hypothetical protein BDV12DRAFT_85176 [Aspergillus spectabilis]